MEASEARPDTTQQASKLNLQGHSRHEDDEEAEEGAGVGGSHLEQSVFAQPDEEAAACAPFILRISWMARCLV